VRIPLWALGLALPACAAAPSFTIQTVAGSAPRDGPVPALEAQFAGAEGICVSPKGIVYVADTAAHRVRAITPEGLVETVAGAGEAGFAGDGGPANKALLHSPFAVETDAQGNLYIADYGNNRIRKVTPAGVISTLFGDGSPAALSTPRALALGRDGILYIAEFEAHRVRALTPLGTMLAVAGTGEKGLNNWSGPALSVPLAYPSALALGPGNLLFVADSGNHRVVKVQNGVLTGFYWEALTPVGLALDSVASLWVADAGNGNVARVFANGQARIAIERGQVNPRSVAFDASGTLVLSDVRRVRTLKDDTLRTLAGDGEFSFGGDGGHAARALLNHPSGVAADPGGGFWIADEGNNRIRRVSPEGYISTAFGDGKASTLNSPAAVAVDGAGSVWVAEYLGNRVLRYGRGDTEALGAYKLPSALAFDPGGKGWVADSGRDRVVSLRDGLFVAGLSGPRGIAFDRAGSLYIADTFHHKVLKINSDGVAGTIAGTGEEGVSRDGVRAGEARLSFPRAVAVDSAFNIFIADTGNHRVRVVTADGLIHTAAGTGVAGFAGDGGPAAAAQLRFPSGLSIDGAGNIYVADLLNHRIRKLMPAAAGDADSMALAVVNAASLLPGPLAPGGLVTLFGRALAPGGEVLIADRAAAVTYSAPGQINARVPLETQGQYAVELRAGPYRQTIRVGADPGVFTTGGGRGQAVVLNQDGAQNSPSNPAARLSKISLFATGFDPTGAEITLHIGGAEAEVLSASPAAGLEGVIEVKALVPAGSYPPGLVAVMLRAAKAVSQPGVAISVR
jgi:uncharacterized protein (TIGR03437 family)